MCASSGEALLKIDSKEVAVGQYDAIYIPRDSNVQITTKSTVDLAEFSAEVAGKCPVQVVRYSDVEKDPGLNFTTGDQGLVVI